jgi:hypothetical protein
MNEELNQPSKCASWGRAVEAKRLSAPERLGYCETLRTGESSAKRGNETLALAAETAKMRSADSRARASVAQCFERIVMLRYRLGHRFSDRA